MVDYKPSKSLMVARKRRTSLPAGVEETKAARFKRLANGRAAVAIEAIERLGNLATPIYEYTETDLHRLRAAIGDALNRAITRLQTRTREPRSKRNVL